MFVGEDLIAWLVLALGGALFAGNVMAIVKPPVKPKADEDLAKAPIARTVFMAIIGFAAAIWSLASLIAG